MELDQSKKYFYKPTHQPCYIANITTQAGGVSGEHNMFVTIRFINDGDVRTFPLGLADELLEELRTPYRLESAGEEDEQESDA